MTAGGYQLVIAPRADDDLEKITGPTGVAVPPHIARSVRDIFAAFDSLRSMPHHQVV